MPELKSQALEPGLAARAPGSRVPGLELLSARPHSPV
jgi:hypothetical protein